MKRFLTAFSPSLLLLLAGCGEPPTPVGEGTSSPSTTAAQATTPPAASSFRASGTIELRGTPEVKGVSSLYISVGIPMGDAAKPNRVMPWISKRIMLSDTERVDAGWRVEFEVTGADAMQPGMPQPPGDLVIKGSFSPSGDALDSVKSEVQPVESGATVDLVLALE